MSEHGSYTQSPHDGVFLYSTSKGLVYSLKENQGEDDDTFIAYPVAFR